MQRQRAYVGGGLQPGAALVVVRLAVVTLQPRSTAPAVDGCRLVGCSVVSGRPLRSRAVARVSQRVRVGLGPVLDSRVPSPPATAAGAWRGRGGPGEARTMLLLQIISARPSKQPLMVRTLLKIYVELGSYFLFLQEQIKDIIIIKVEQGALPRGAVPLLQKLLPSTATAPPPA